MINFDQIKTNLVNKGLAIKEDADQATQQYIGVHGEWRPDGSARIIKVTAGWRIGSFLKGEPVSLELPEAKNFSISEILDYLKQQFPGVKISIAID